jgi:hypothetical protein
MATTVLCLFREPLPPGKLSSTTAGVTEVHVEEDGRCVAEITIKKPEKGGVIGIAFSSLASSAVRFASPWIGVNDALGEAELVLPAGEFNSRRHTGPGPRYSAAKL